MVVVVVMVMVMNEELYFTYKIAELGPELHEGRSVAILLMIPIYFVPILGFVAMRRVARCLVMNGTVW